MYDNEAGHQRSFFNNDTNGSTVNASQVGDPMKASTKGARKDNITEGNIRMSKNGRELSFDEGKTHCSVCKLRGHNRRSIKCKFTLSKCFIYIYIFGKVSYSITFLC